MDMVHYRSVAYAILFDEKSIYKNTLKFTCRIIPNNHKGFVWYCVNLAHPLNNLLRRALSADYTHILVPQLKTNYMRARRPIICASECDKRARPSCGGFTAHHVIWNRCVLCVCWFVNNSPFLQLIYLAYHMGVRIYMFYFCFVFLFQSVYRTIAAIHKIYSILLPVNIRICWKLIQIKGAPSVWVMATVW